MASIASEKQPAIKAESKPKFDRFLRCFQRCLRRLNVSMLNTSDSRNTKASRIGSIASNRLP